MLKSIRKYVAMMMLVVPFCAFSQEIGDLTTPEVVPQVTKAKYRLTEVRVLPIQEIMIVRYEKGYINGDGAFVAVERKSYIVKNHTQTNEETGETEPVVGQQYWTQFINSAVYIDFRTLLANHLRNVGEI